MCRISSLRRDCRGGALLKFTLVVALVGTPMLYPTRTKTVLKNAQSSWEYVWSIEGMSGEHI